MIYDEWRDAIILFQKKADVLYRVTGRYINFHTQDVISITIEYKADFFSTELFQMLKSKANYNSLVSNEDLFNTY